MDIRVGGWMDGWIDIRVDGLTLGWMGGLTLGWMDGWIDIRVDGLTLHSKKRWVVLTQFWVKYGQTRNVGLKM